MATLITVISLVGICWLVRDSNASRPHIKASRERTVRMLNQGIAESFRIFKTHSPMEGTGRALEASGYKWGISPFFIAAATATESSLGRASCGNDVHNGMGMNSCQGWRWAGCRAFGEPLHAFRSWAGVYDYYARYLARCWPSARTTYDYRGYAACSPCWGRKTAWWMRRLFGLGYGTRYA